MLSSASAANVVDLLVGEPDLEVKGGGAVGEGALLVLGLVDDRARAGLDEHLLDGVVGARHSLGHVDLGALDGHHELEGLDALDGLLALALGVDRSPTVPSQ